MQFLKTSHNLVTICLLQCNIYSHYHSSWSGSHHGKFLNGCVKLHDIDRSCQHAVAHIIPAHPKDAQRRHVWWEWGHQEPGCVPAIMSNSFNMEPFNIRLQHEVMVSDHWNENRSQGLIMVHLSSQTGFDKMLSVTCLWLMPTHTITPPPPRATILTPLAPADRSPTQSLAGCLPSAQCSSNWDSSVNRILPEAIGDEHFPVEDANGSELQSG